MNNLFKADCDQNIQGASDADWSASERKTTNGHFYKLSDSADVLCGIAENRIQLLYPVVRQNISECARQYKKLYF